MSFELNDTQISIINSAKNISEKFDDDYWLDCDLNSKFPQEFYEEVASGGWLGMCMPEKFGGSNLGIREASLFMQTISESGGGMAAASSIHINIFGPHPIVIHGTQKQKETWLPPLITGQEKTCFGVTEPDSGLDTSRLKTKAKKAIAGFKIRAGMPLGVSVTLRNKIMYEFLDRLINIAIPRIRDFRGLNSTSFDGNGNYSMGIKEQIIFPEINYDKIDKVRGLDITICTSAKNNKDALELLKSFNMPFKGKEIN